MLIKSTIDNKYIPYHDKVMYSFNKILGKVHNKLIDTSPILSGSAAISLLYAPKKAFSDLDLYFSKESDYLNAFNFIKEVVPQTKENTYIDTKDNEEDIDEESNLLYYITDNAVSVVTPAYKIQLIKREFLSPEELIYKHDFTNVSVAISPQGIYTTKETNSAWFEKKLVLRNYQIKDDASLEDTLMFYYNFLNRVNKYRLRYSLKLSNELYFKIKTIKDNLNYLLNDDSSEQVTRALENVALNTNPYYSGERKIFAIASLKSKLLDTAKVLLASGLTLENSNNENILF